MTIKGGTVKVAPDKEIQLNSTQDYGSSIYLDGGVLETPSIRRTAKWTTIYFNGGTIDCGGYPVKISVGASVSNGGIRGSGGLTFTGGNTITLSTGTRVYYSGKTSITPGTTLVVSNDVAKSTILNNGIVVAGIPTVGQTIFTYMDDLTGTDISKVTCPLAPDTVFAIGGEDNKSIVVENAGTPLDVNYWTGAAMTLGAGTTLWLNTATLCNTLNLPTGENEVATIRIDGTKLSGGDHTIATVGAGATANVALDPASTALDGRKGSLRVEGGNLVLNVKSKGTMLIIR